ncbi:hypothetical protein NQ317_015006 [Molorchus minor]|uniref:CBM39 domain-containing protein n=1 Tax=Molorchus minor TaxID=1323400 RepID=A0ABQ9K615_9CUCU|nr:hypothetical protein NQ317_015006 [Molorchus minor]
MNTTVWFILVFLSCTLNLVATTPPHYSVPDPTIEVFSPKGFRVSIPDDDGISVFAFHGDINRPVENLEAGRFSKDILRKKCGKWIFEDRHTKLVKGDVIHFWLFVIKHRLGYRYDNGEFTVTELTPSNELINGPPLSCHDEEKTDLDGINTDPICEIRKNLTDTVDSLRRQVEEMQEVTEILKDLLGRNNGSSISLMFEGALPPGDDAMYTARLIIAEKLDIPVPVVHASWNEDRSIIFKVASLDEKLIVIRASKEKLKNSKIRILY